MRDAIIYNSVVYDGGKNELVSGYITLGESLACSALSVDTLEVTVVSEAAVTAVYGGAVDYMRGGELFARFYCTSVERTGRSLYTLHAVSAIGLLDGTRHFGGVYMGLESSVTAPELIAEIIGGAFDFTVDAAFDDVLLYGHLPAASRRENLRQVLFAIGANIRKAPDGTVEISALGDTAVNDIPRSRIFAGGKVGYSPPATAVRVTEHAYLKTAESAERIYSGEIRAGELITPRGESVTGQLIEFREPYYGLLCDGAEILESGANYAVLSPSAGAVLTGRKYTHASRVLTFGEISGEGAFVPEVKDCTLVSAANSSSVGARVLAYYSGGRDVTQDIALAGEKPGDRVSFSDPYGEISSGYIKNMDITLGALLRGTCVFDTGYVPRGIGNDYGAVLAVTSSGVITLPDADRIRVILIGGGSGGQGGGRGEDGRLPTVDEYIPGVHTYTVETTETGLFTDDYPLGTRPGGAAGYIWYKSVENVGGSLVYSEESYRPMRNGAAVLGLEGAMLAYENGYRFTPFYYGGTNLGRTKCVGIELSQEYGGLIYTLLEPRINTEEIPLTVKRYEDDTPGGRGGDGGLAGSPGRVWQMDIEITPGAAAEIVIGSGGQGGAASATALAGSAGEPGGDTTVKIGGAIYSSANGSIPGEGYSCLFNGQTYALRGADGLAGGDGGAYSGYNTPGTGGRVGISLGGDKGSGISYEATPNTAYSGGGSGGGASATANGGRGGNASAVSTGDRSRTVYTSGSGGRGASASPPEDASVRGSAGSGGHGGGGGGNAGGYADERDPILSGLGSAGIGGDGSRGGNGAPGIVLIFYSDAGTRCPLIEADGKQVLGSDGRRIMLKSAYTSSFTGAEIDNFITEVSG